MSSGRGRTSNLVPAVEERSARVGSAIHRGLTGTRALIGTDYLSDDALRRAYEQEIAPRTTAAMRRILAEVFPGAESAAGLPARLRVIDLGAGTGAAGTAIRGHFGDRVELVAVDKHVRGPGTRNLDVTSPRDMRSLGGPFDLVIAAHVLNELFVEDVRAATTDTRGPVLSSQANKEDNPDDNKGENTEDPDQRLSQLTAVVRLWLDRLMAPTGTMVLVEPALRETSRVLLRVRDRLRAAGLHIVAPCFYQDGCPALRRERDWCHDRVMAPHDGGSQGSTSQDRRPIDFSYLVVRRASSERGDPALVRIVSDPLPEKGKLRLFACGSSFGRLPLVRLHRHASPANADMDLLVRGDVARLSPDHASTTPAASPPRSDGIRIAASTRIERVSLPSTDR